jgi:hypothetical protein
MNSPAIASTRPLRILGIALAAIALLASRTAGAADGAAQQARAHIANLRAVAAPADAKTIAGFNRQMDEAWEFFSANKADALPVLREQLAAEMRQAKPHGLVMLDLGYFLFLNGTDPDKELAKSALFALDTSSTVVH